MQVPVPKKAPAAVEPPPGICPECGGTGWKVRPDGGNGTAVACDCSKSRRGVDLLALAQIPERYQHCRLSNFKTDFGQSQPGGSLNQAREASELYIRDFVPDGRGSTTGGLIFVGPPGVGKTHLAVAVLRDLVERFRVRGRFAEFTELLHQIQATFGDSSRRTREQIMQPVIDAEVLVLDELGAQKPSQWVMDILYLIINTRYTRKLPTIFTSNFDLPSSQSGQRSGREEGTATLDHRISALLVSRIFEMARKVKVSGPDFRREVKHWQNLPGK